jgi:hypothetical protein
MQIAGWHWLPVGVQSRSWAHGPVVLVVLPVVVVVVVGVGAGAQRRPVPFTVTWWVPNWSVTVAVGDAFGHFAL